MHENLKHIYGIIYDVNAIAMINLMKWQRMLYDVYVFFTMPCSNKSENFCLNFANDDASMYVTLASNG